MTKTAPYNNISIIQAIQSQGWRVFIKHKRTKSPIPTKKIDIKNGFSIHYANAISPKGGETRVEIQKNGICFYGTAKCRPDESFCKQQGVSVALGRALKSSFLFVDTESPNS